MSLPFKLIFFVLVDGWSLVAGSPRSFFSTTLATGSVHCSKKLLRRL